MITGKDAPEGTVRFAIDPKISKSDRDAYTITSGWRASVPANSGRASQPASLTITGSNLRSMWYGLYDLLERRGVRSRLVSMKPPHGGRALVARRKSRHIQFRQGIRGADAQG